MTRAIIMEACACPLWGRYRSKLDFYTDALPSRAPVTPTEPARFRRQQSPIYWLVFLQPRRTTVAARSVIAPLSLLSKAFNDRHSTKKRSARPPAR